MKPSGFMLAFATLPALGKAAALYKSSSLLSMFSAADTTCFGVSISGVSTAKNAWETAKSIVATSSDGVMPWHTAAASTISPKSKITSASWLISYGGDNTVKSPLTFSKTLTTPLQDVPDTSIWLGSPISLLSSSAVSEISGIASSMTTGTTSADEHSLSTAVTPNTVEQTSKGSLPRMPYGNPTLPQASSSTLSGLSSFVWSTEAGFYWVSTPSSMPTLSGSSTRLAHPSSSASPVQGNFPAPSGSSASSSSFTQAESFASTKASATSVPSVPSTLYGPLSTPVNAPPFISPGSSIQVSPLTPAWPSAPPWSFALPRLSVPSWSFLSSMLFSQSVSSTPLVKSTHSSSSSSAWLPTPSGLPSSMVPSVSLASSALIVSYGSSYTSKQAPSASLASDTVLWSSISTSSVVGSQDLLWPWPPAWSTNPHEPGPVQVSTLSWTLSSPYAQAPSSGSVNHPTYSFALTEQNMTVTRTNSDLASTASSLTQVVNPLSTEVSELLATKSMSESPNLAWDTASTLSSSLTTNISSIAYTASNEATADEMLYITETVTEPCPSSLLIPGPSFNSSPYDESDVALV